MNELHLFAGAGGGILGGMLLGHTCVCAVEIEEYPRKILLQRQRDGVLPRFPIWDDIRTFDANPWRGNVDIICGGFPCQDISAAGKGAGIEGERSGLWSEMARVISEVRPQFVFVENSPLLVGRGLSLVLADLAKMGFDARWGIVGAHHAGAPHKRDRIWILAHSISKRGCGWNSRWENAVDADPGCQKWMQDQTAIQTEENWECVTCGLDIFNGCDHYHGEWECLDCGEWTYPFYYEPEDGCQFCGSSNILHPTGAGLPHGSTESMGESKPDAQSERTNWWTTEPELGRVAHGLAHRVDRLKAIGNGQVPAVVELAWEIVAQS